MGSIPIYYPPKFWNIQLVSDDGKSLRVIVGEIDDYYSQDTLIYITISRRTYNLVKSGELLPRFEKRRLCLYKKILD